MLISGCATRPVPAISEFEYVPARAVADGVVALVQQHAERSAFAPFGESSMPPVRLRTFAAIERITSDRQYSAAERAEQREWFRSAHSIWHHTFECQYAAVLFTDAAGRVQHAILLG